MNSTYIKYSIILGILTAFGPICTDFYLPALPEITQNLNTSATLSQLTLTAALFGLGIGQLFFGSWSDRVGRKKPLLIALILFTLSSLGCVFVQNIEQMIAVRFIQGFAGAGGAVLARAIANDLYSGNELAHFFALMMAINGIAPILAPVFGGLQLGITHWRGLFLSLTGLGIIIFLICYIGLTESHIRQSKIVQSLSLMGVFKTVIKDKIFLGLCLIQSLMMGGLFAYIGASSYVFQDIYHFSAQHYSLLFAVNGCGLIASALLTSKLLNIYQTSQLLRAGLILAIVASSALMLLSLFHAPIYLSLIALFITLSTVSSISTLSSTLAMERQNEYSGTASALIGFFMFGIGGLTAPLTTMFETSLFSMSIVVFGCYLLAFISYRFVIHQQKSIPTRN